jgi:hypothetical protein
MCMDYTYIPNLKHKIHNVTRGTNVILCCYKINNTGRQPFLEYLLTDVNDTLDFHTVPLFTGVPKGPRKPPRPKGEFGPTFSKGWVEQNGDLSTSDISTIASNFLFKVTGVAFSHEVMKSEQNFVPFFSRSNEKGGDEHILSYTGYKKYNGCIYVFIDISCAKLKVCQNAQLCLVDEMVNVKHVYNKPIAPMVTNFVRDNMSLFTILDTNNKAFEIPSAVYVGCDEANLNFTYTFSNKKSHHNSILGPHYYFTDFENASKEYGTVRFAIFPGHTLVKLNFPNEEIDESLLKQQKLDNKYELMTQRITDYDGKWAANYESVYLGHMELDDGQILKNTPIIVVKSHDQQIPMDYQIIHDVIRHLPSDPPSPGGSSSTK